MVNRTRSIKLKKKKKTKSLRIQNPNFLTSDLSMATINLRKGNTRLPPEVNRVLYVRNLPFNITSEEMYDIFGKYGAIRQIRIGTNKDTRGTAFVVYEDIYDAKTAVDHLSGFNVANRYLIVLYYQHAKMSKKFDQKKKEEELTKLQEKYGVTAKDLNDYISEMLYHREACNTKSKTYSTWQPPRRASMTKYFSCSRLTVTSFKYSRAKIIFCFFLHHFKNVITLFLKLCRNPYCCNTILKTHWKICTAESRFYW
ncbi:putative RNA recognition motif domain, nucleotide-binding alpha-beta plait domain superfamily [Helianthus debilis subsp. tardiflorus]